MDIREYIESGVIESYVLGLADAQEAAELELLSRQHPEIRDAVDAFAASLESHALAHAIPPPAGVKEKLISELKDSFVVNNVTAAPPVISIHRRTRYLAAAAVILLVVSAGLNIYFYNQFRDTRNQYQALLIQKNSLLAENNVMQARSLNMYEGMQMMSDPAVRKVSMSGAGTGVKERENNLATVFWDSKTKDVYLLGNKLPQAPAGKQYQLWAIVNGKPVDAGMLGDCQGLCRMKNITGASAFAITLEKAGGVAQPTLSELQVIGKV